jgi:internalin A
LRVLDLGHHKPWDFGTKPNRIDAQWKRLACLRSLEVLLVAGADLISLDPIRSLQNLQQLDCSGTQVTDLMPLAGLSALQQLNCSGCRLKCLPPNIFSKPSLQYLVLYDSHVPGVPPTGILSQYLYEGCLDRVRAHFADLAVGSEVMVDIKLLPLGNGGAGKTQIARWLAGEPFDPAWNSTHGIQVGSALLPGDSPARLHIWDFGGQDIYHGTQALF